MAPSVSVLYELIPLSCFPLTSLKLHSRTKSRIPRQTRDPELPFFLPKPHPSQVSSMNDPADWWVATLTRTSHQLTAATADMALPASLRSIGLLDVSQRIRLRGLQSQA